MGYFFEKRDFGSSCIKKCYYAYLGCYCNTYSESEKKYPISLYFGKDEVAFYFRGRVRACFKITEETLEDLGLEKVPSDVLERLRGIIDREFTVEKEFVDVLTRTIGKKQSDRFGSSILKHASRGEFISQKIMSWYVAEGTLNQEKLSQTIENYWKVETWPLLEELEGMHADAHLKDIGYTQVFGISPSITDTGSNTSVPINLRALILDFLFEMDHTGTFEDENFFALQPMLQNNSVLDALSKQGAFLIEERRAQEQGSTYRYMSKLHQTFFDWLNVCIQDANRAIFESPNSVFNGVETPSTKKKAKPKKGKHRIENIEQIVCSTVFDRKRPKVKGLVFQFDKGDPRLQHSVDRMINALKLVKRWFFLRYDLTSAERIFWAVDKLELFRDRECKGRLSERHSTGLRRWVNGIRTLFYIAFFLFFGLCIVNAFTDRARPLLNGYAVALVGGVGAATLITGFFAVFRRRIGLFRLTIPRLLGGILIGQFALFTTDEAWAFVRNNPPGLLFILSPLLVGASLTYVFTEINNFIKDRKKALQRAWQIVGIGLIESLVVGILVINLFGIIRTEGYRTGSAQASIHYEPNGMVSFRSGHALERLSIGVKRISDPWIGHLYKKIGHPPIFIFLPALVFWTTLALFVGVFFQLLWQDKPITEPL